MTLLKAVKSWEAEEFERHSLNLSTVERSVQSAVGVWRDPIACSPECAKGRFGTVPVEAGRFPARPDLETLWSGTVTRGEKRPPSVSGRSAHAPHASLPEDCCRQFPQATHHRLLGLHMSARSGGGSHISIELEGTGVFHVFTSHRACTITMSPTPVGIVYPLRESDGRA